MVAKKVEAVRIEDQQPQARCLSKECPWKHEPSRGTSAASKAHTRETGHRVQVVRCRVIEYDLVVK